MTGQFGENFFNLSAFKSANSFNCIARDITTPSNAVTIQYFSNAITLTGTGSDVIRYTCWGE